MIKIFVKYVCFVNRNYLNIFSTKKKNNNKNITLINTQIRFFFKLNTFDESKADSKIN